jgi:hypothetical protein
MASTYVNDLRLNEMATGDGSGTWGTTTNTNLELIAEAFSYGTEVITTNADTHTTTIADGATDPGRALYLKYTGTLDSACTITIGPNTVSKVWIIENGTSGSQDIILSQGSGANITIPAGDTKVVYSDGAGAGAAFVDAFASLSVVDLKVQDDLTVTGDIDVDGTTNLDIVDIDGAVDFASTTAHAGDATFADNAKAIFGAGSDLQIYHDGSNSRIDDVGTGDLIIKASAGIELKSYGTNQTAAYFNGDGAAALYHNGLLKFATTATGIQVTGDIANASGDLTLDVAGEIVLDADTNGVVRINDAGSNFGAFFKNGTTFTLKSEISDYDMVFAGNDGGVGITALTLDMSAAGAATFNSTVTVPTNLFVGTSIVHQGDSNTSIDFQSDVMDLYSGGSLGVRVQPAAVTINETGGDSDFRVESDNNTHALFVDGANGNVGINTSAPTTILDVGGIGSSVNSTFNGIAITAASAFSGVTGNVGLYLSASNSGGSLNGFFRTKAGAGGTYDGVEIATDNRPFRILTSTTEDTNERLRIDTNGNVFVGLTSISGAAGKITSRGLTGSYYALRCDTGTTASDTVAAFSNPNGVVGGITTSGSATAYNTSSDYRLKEDDVPMTGATERVKALRPINFAWKVDGSRVDGFLAHEAQEVVPECVTGSKDAMRDEEYEVTPAVEEVRDEDGNVTTEAVAAVMGTRSVPDYQGIDQSKLVPLLTAALQEAITKIEDLTTRLETLENA